MTKTASTETAYGAGQVVSREELKPFVRRTDRHALTHLIIHMAAIGGSGVLVYLTLSTGWVAPAMLLHAILMVNIYSPIHEGSHGTPYRTRWLNEAVYRFLSLIYVQPPLYFRYRHAAHHTHTQIRGWYPDFPVREKPRRLDYLWYVSAIPFWMRNIEWLVRNALGNIDPADYYFLPKDEFPRLHREARVYLAIYAAIAAVAIYLGSWVPVIILAAAAPHRRAFSALDQHRRAYRPHGAWGSARQYADDPGPAMACLPALEHELSRRTPYLDAGPVPCLAEIACQVERPNDLSDGPAQRSPDHPEDHGRKRSAGGGDHRRVAPSRGVDDMTEIADTTIAYGRDKIISRQELKPFVKRTDRHGLVYFVGHSALLGRDRYFGLCDARYVVGRAGDHPAWFLHVLPVRAGARVQSPHPVPHPCG